MMNFLGQGVFSIKATPMGSTLVLLEGGKEEEDLKGFVEEAEDWLLQWFKSIRPWKQTDVYKERLALISYFGIPICMNGVLNFLQSFLIQLGCINILMIIRKNEDP